MMENPIHVLEPIGVKSFGTTFSTITRATRVHTIILFKIKQPLRKDAVSPPKESLPENVKSLPA